MKLGQLVEERTALCKALVMYEDKMSDERKKAMFDKIGEYDRKISVLVEKIWMEEEELEF